MGRLSKPTPVATDDLDSIILSPRFRIDERHGAQEPKFRLIGDRTKSNVNKSVQMSETYRTQGGRFLCCSYQTPTRKRRC